LTSHASVDIFLIKDILNQKSMRAARRRSPPAPQPPARSILRDSSTAQPGAQQYQAGTARGIPEDNGKADSMAQKRVLLIGIDPTLVDFDPARGLNADRVRAAGDEATARLEALGHEVQTCIVDRGETAESVVRKTLSQKQFDCVMIGAGLRASIEDTLLFERIMNVVHEKAPLAKLCFNSHPATTAEAVLRWL